MIADALRLSVYFGESITTGPRLASDALMGCFADHGLVTAALLRGIEGFGLNRRIDAERFPDASADLPLLATAVDSRDRIRGALQEVDRALPRGLVTLEHARLATGDAQDVCERLEQARTAAAWRVSAARLDPGSPCGVPTGSRERKRRDRVDS